MEAYDKMTEKELELARIDLDKQIQLLRDQKKKIQDVIDSRTKPLGPASHTIGGANG